MNLSNTVIKVLNKEHGKKVIQWWKDQGVNTFDRIGSNVGSYYGVSGGFGFTNWYYIPEGYTEIELPNELPKRGDRILVWDYDEKNAEEKIFLTIIEGAYLPVVCVAVGDETKFLNNEVVRTVLWKHYRLIETKKEISFTVEEIANKLGITLDQVKDMKIIFGQESK